MASAHRVHHLLHDIAAEQHQLTDDSDDDSDSPPAVPIPNNRSSVPIATRYSEAQLTKVRDDAYKFVNRPDSKLAESAREQVKRAELLHQWRDEQIKQKPAPDEAQWQSSLEQWKERRRKASNQQVTPVADEKASIKSGLTASKPSLSPPRKLSTAGMHLLSDRNNNTDTSSLLKWDDSGTNLAQQRRSRLLSRSGDDDDTTCAPAGDISISAQMRFRSPTKASMPNTDGTDSGLDTNRGSLSPGRTDESSVASPPGSHTHSPVAVAKLSDEDRVISIELHTPPGDRNFGFTVRGGKDRHEAVRVDSLTIDGPAARAGLHTGDVIVRINGEETTDKLLSKLNHMVHESLRLGEIELIVRRTPSGAIVQRIDTEANSFDAKRSLFEKASSEQNTPRHNGTITSHNGASRKWHTREMHNPAAGRGPNFTPSAVNTKVPIFSRPPPARAPDEISVRHHVPLPELPPMEGNYRVSALTPERTVGKLSDFVPESERDSPRRQVQPQVPCSEPPIEKECNSVERGLDPLLTRDRYALIRQQASAKPIRAPADDRPPRAVVKNKEVLKQQVDTSVASPLVQSTAPVRQAVARQAARQLGNLDMTARHHTATTTSRLTEQLNTEQQDGVLSVSGKQKCSHCCLELGRGAAMIIESLGLFYHLACFKCCVCSASLGNGTHGADVRVRGGKLHCHACYSNDDAGWQYSEV